MPANINDRCNNTSYKKPTKFRLTVKDRYSGTQLEQVDGFQTYAYNEGLNIFAVNVSNTMDGTGQFSYSFADKEHVIDTTKVGKGNIIILEAAKDSAADYENIAYGFCRDMNPSRSRGNMLTWTMTGFGTSIIFNEILCTFIRSAKSLSLQDPRPRIDDEDMFANNLWKSFLTDPQVPIYGDQSLAQIGGFTTNGIDPAVHDPVTAINAKNQYAGAISNTILQSVGALGGIDADNDAYLIWPTKRHSGITVKVQQSEAEMAQDYAAFTGYVQGTYQAPQSLQLPDYANVITGRASISKEFLGGASGASNSKSTNGQALAQQFKPSSLGFKDIALMLQKVGDPTSSKNRLNGSIILDNGNTPKGGKKVADWYIDLGRIKDEAGPVSFTELKLFTKTIEATQAHWLVVYERAGHHSGDFDESNTILWFNNGDTTTPFQYSAFALGGDKDSPNLPWQVLPNGPTFAFSLFQIVRRQAFAVDPIAMKLFGPIMVPVDASFIDDNFTMNKFLHVELQQRVRPKINFSEIEVSIPNNSNFKPGTMVTFLDPQNPMFTIQKYCQPLVSAVTWTWDASVRPQGCRTVRLLLSARYDWLSDYFAE